jgi:hypothetical protein
VSRITVDVSGDQQRWAAAMGIAELPTLVTASDWDLCVLPTTGSPTVVCATTAMIHPEEPGGAAEPVVILSETTVKAFIQAAGVLHARYPGVLDDGSDPGFAVLSTDARGQMVSRWSEAVRRVVTELDAERATELAEMLVDGLAIGVPPQGYEW